MLYDKEIDLVYLIDFGRAGCVGSVVNDLAYLLDSIVKVKCTGGTHENIKYLFASVTSLGGLQFVSAIGEPLLVEFVGNIVVIYKTSVFYNLLP